MIGLGIASGTCAGACPAITAGEEEPAQGRAGGAPAQRIVQSVRDLGVQFRDNDVGVTGQDGATSIVLPDGTACWVFGDTIEYPVAAARSLDLTNVLSNTAAIVPPQNAARGIRQYKYLTSADGKRPRQLILFSADENSAKHRLWGMHGVCVGDFLYLYYHKITMLPKRDVFDTFRLDGMGLARARIGAYQFERLAAADGTREFWKGDEPGFGVFVEQGDDGLLYLWGCLKTGMHLARTRPDTIEDAGSYQYLVEAPTVRNPAVQPRWDRTFRPTAVLFAGVPNEMSAAYNPHLGKHVATHTHFRANKLALRTAPGRTGPWSEPEIFHQPAKIHDDDLFYAGKEHPELARAGGKVLYVTYVNHSVYMPHLVEVTLA